MADDKARIEASLEGGAQVAREAKRIENALGDAGDRAEKKLGGALSSVGKSLTGVVQGALTAAGVFQSINLAKAVEDVKKLDEMTGKLGRSSGLGSGAIQSTFASLEQKILTSSLAQAEFAKGLGRVTYDSKYAVGALGALGTEALAAGRSLDEEAPIAKALHGMGVKADDVAGELDKIRAIAEKVGSVGGHLAVKDGLAGLTSELQRVSSASDETRAKLYATLEIAAKGQKTPEAAQQVRGAVMGYMRSHAVQIERMTGHRVLDDDGNVIDKNVNANLQALGKMSKGQFRGNDRARRMSLQDFYGTEMGLAIYRGGFEGADDLAKAKAADAAKKREAEAAAALKDPAGVRTGKELEKQSAARELGKYAVGADSYLTDTLGTKGAIAAELGLGLGGFGLAMKAGGGVLKAGAGALGAGGTAALALAAGDAYMFNEAYKNNQAAQAYRYRDHPREADGSLANMSMYRSMDNPMQLGPATEAMANASAEAAAQAFASQGGVIGDAIAEGLRRALSQDGVTLKVNELHMRRPAGTAGTDPG